MHRIHKIHLRILPCQIPYRRTHTDEPLPEILPPVPRYQHHPFVILRERSDRRIFRHITFSQHILHDPVQRINHRIPRHRNPLLRHPFVQQILPAQCRRRKIIRGNPPRHLPVHFLRPGAVKIMRPKPCLHVSHRNLPIERRHRRRHRSRRVPMDQNDIGLDLIQHIPHPGQHPRRDIVQVLPLLHDIQIIIRLHIENCQHLVQHFPMLPRHAHNRLERLRILLERLHQRTHLNRLRPRSKHQHYLFHI